jgi:hypothetical protein
VPTPNNINIKLTCTVGRVQYGTLQNNTCYKTVHVTEQYVIQDGTCYTTVRFTRIVQLQNDILQNGTHKTVPVTKRYFY